MDSINKVEIQGFVGTVTVNSFENTRLYRFSVCTNQTFTENGSIVVENTWHSIKAFDKKITGVLEKGKYVNVKGYIKNEKYIDSFGRDINVNVIIANEVTVL